MRTTEEWSRKYDAPPGTVWVCVACGKRASNRANGGLSYGWDESCFLAAALCEETQNADGMWVPVETTYEELA